MLHVTNLLTDADEIIVKSKVKNIADFVIKDAGLSSQLPNENYVIV